MTPPGRSDERGFTLIETLVTVVIMGIAFSTFVGGMGSAILVSDYHRKQAVVSATLRNFAEALKSSATTYVACATTSSYKDAFSAPPPPRTSAGALTNGGSHAAPSVVAARPNSRRLAFYTLASGSSFTPASGATEQWDVASTSATLANRVTASLDDQARSNAGATGSLSGASATPANGIAQSVLLESATAAAGSIVRRGVTTAVASGLTTLTLAKPAGTIAGDTMLAQIAVRGGTATSVSAPMGWLLVDEQNNGLSVKSLVFERTATSPTASSYTWTFGSSPEAAGGIISYGGVVKAYSASITSVRYWNGTSFVATCPTPDAGLQRLSLSVSATDGRGAATVDIVKRRP